MESMMDALYPVPVMRAEDVYIRGCVFLKNDCCNDRPHQWFFAD